MGQEQFVAMMPFVCSDLLQMIIEQKKMTEEQALNTLYDSKLYALLERESTKLWQYSTPMLYALLEQELTTGTIQFPDV